MDLLKDKRSIKAEFEAQVTAALIIQSNALIPIKLAVRLCGISRAKIMRRIGKGTFPKTAPLFGRRAKRPVSFYLSEIHKWIRNPHTSELGGVR